MDRRLSLSTALFFVLLAATLLTAILVVRARTPDLVLEVTDPAANEDIVFSPIGGPPPHQVDITFFVREGDNDALVAIVDSQEQIVRTLDSRRRARRARAGHLRLGRSQRRRRLRDAGPLPAARRPARRRPRDDLAAPDSPVVAGGGGPVTASAAELVGMLAACGAAAAGIALPDRRQRTLAIAIAVIAAPVLVVADVWNEPRVADFRGEPAQVAAALVVAGLALAALTATIRRRPGVLRDRRGRDAPDSGPARDRRRDREPAGAALSRDLRRSDRSRPRRPRRARRDAARPRRIRGRLGCATSSPPGSCSTRCRRSTPRTSPTRWRTSASSSHRSPSSSAC